MITSQKFSKQLKDNGCELESEWYWVEKKQWTFNKKGVAIKTKSKFILEKWGEISEFEHHPAYDTLNDICVRHAVKFFGKSKFIPKVIFNMIRQSKSQASIEKYIWDVCLFNPKNKKENEKI